MKITLFEDIEAWQIRGICADWYITLSKKENFSRDYGLKDQVCRACVSIMANIARPVK
jgi:four helix bundle protein